MSHVAMARYLLNRNSLQMYAVLLCLFGATLCGGVMDRRRADRIKRPYIYRHNYGPLVPRSIPHDPVLKVTVFRTQQEMAEGDVVVVRCNVKSGKNLAEYPFINFFRKFGRNRVMPLMRGMPGVTIRRMATVTSENHTQAKSFLRLGPEAYYTLMPGYNLFYCKASHLDGLTKRVYFTIKKI